MDRPFNNRISKTSGFRMFPVFECPVFGSLLYCLLAPSKYHLLFTSSEWKSKTVVLAKTNCHKNCFSIKLFFNKIVFQ